MRNGWYMNPDISIKRPLLWHNNLSKEK